MTTLVEQFKPEILIWPKTALIIVLELPVLV